MWLQTLEPAQRLAMLNLAHNVIVSDGLLDPNEERMMDALRQEMAIDAEIESRYIELDGLDGVFPTRRSRIVALINLLHLSYADGAFEVEEECFLKELAHVFEVSDATFALLDNWVRRFIQLEQELDLVVQ